MKFKKYALPLILVAVAAAVIGCQGEDDSNGNGTNGFSAGFTTGGASNGLTSSAGSNGSTNSGQTSGFQF